jgi:hypothetical protein
MQWGFADEQLNDNEKSQLSSIRPVSKDPIRKMIEEKSDYSKSESDPDNSRQRRKRRHISKY